MRTMVMTTTMRAHPHRCPVCACATLAEPGAFELCPVCGWEDDPDQAKDPTRATGANSVSLDVARARYRKGEPIEDDLAVPTRAPRPSERPPAKRKR